MIGCKTLPCQMWSGGKKWLLLAKECFDLLETTAIRKKLFEQFYFLEGF